MSALSAVAGRDDDGRPRILDDRRAGDPRARRQAIAIDSAASGAARRLEPAGPTLVGSGMAAVAGQRTERRRRGTARADAQALHLPMLARSRSRRARGGGGGKSRPSVARSSGIGEGHFHGVALADIAHQGHALDRDRRRAWPWRCSGAISVSSMPSCRRAETLGVPVGAQHAHGSAAGCSSCRRRCSPAPRSPTRSAARRSRAMPNSRARRAACIGPAPPKASSVHCASVDAALDRDAAQRPHHRGIGDAAARRAPVSTTLTPRRCASGASAASAASTSRLMAPPRRRVGIEIAQHRVGVGHGRVSVPPRP